MPGGVNVRGGGVWRITGFRFFLTYPQCGELTKDDCLKQLRVKVNPNEIVEYVVAQEAHEDGNPHLHVYIKLARKMNVKDPKKFDVVSGGNVLHGNYQAVRTQADVIKYCKKDGDFIKSDNVDVEEKDSVWSRAVAKAKAGDAAGAMELIVEEKPRDALMHSSDLQKGILNLMPHADYESPVFAGEWDLPGDLTFAWPKCEATHTLILSGNSGYGKTSWLRSQYVKHHFVTHLDQVRKCAGDKIPIIYDDVRFKDLDREQIIAVTDVVMDRQIHCRYTPGFVKAGTIRIISTNETCYEDLFGLDGSPLDAIKRRCVWITLVRKLFKDAEVDAVVGPAAAAAIAAAAVPDPLPSVPEFVHSDRLYPSDSCAPVPLEAEADHVNDLLDEADLDLFSDEDLISYEHAQPLEWAPGPVDSYYDESDYLGN